MKAGPESLIETYEADARLRERRERTRRRAVDDELRYLGEAVFRVKNASQKMLNFPIRIRLRKK
jgi:hypothetical protein